MASMEQPFNEPLNEALAEALVAYQERLDTADDNAPTSSPESAVSAELRERYERCAACLDLLVTVRDAASDASDETQPLPVSSTGASDAEATIATRYIGRFRLHEELGAGGFGIVYRAYDPITRRDVALKIPRFEVVASAGLQQRFEQEACAAARLDHPHIAAVLEAGRDGLLPYIASTYYPGVTLAAWLQQAPASVSAREAALLIKLLAGALAHSHERGVLHRDVKPSNILLVTTEYAARRELISQYVPKLMDFGLAKLAQTSGDMTRSGAMLGTLRYMPPEQAAGRTKDIGPTSDIYGLGAVLYELLAGRAPFEAADDWELLGKIQRQEPARLQGVRSDVPRDLETIAFKCLHKEPAKRYYSAQLLADDLDNFLAGRPILARPTSPAERLTKWCRRNPGWFSAAIVSTVALSSMLLGLLWSNLQIRKERDLEIASRTRAERSEILAREHEQQALSRAYSFDMRQARDLVISNAPEAAKQYLARYLPMEGSVDLRDFSWHLLKREIDDAQSILASHEKNACVAASPAGEVFATGGGDGILRIWNLSTRKQLAEVKAHTGTINAIVFAPDGASIVTAAGDFTIKQWAIPSGELIQRLPAGLGWISSLSFSADGKLLASSGSDKAVRLWDLASGKCLATLTGHKDTIRSVVFSKYGNLFSTSEDGEVRCWNVEKRASDSRLERGLLPRGVDLEHSIVYALAVEANGDFLVGAMWDGGFERWDITPDGFGKLVGEQLHLPVVPRCVASTSDDVLCFGLATGSIQFARAGADTAGKILAARHGVAGRVNSIALIPRSRSLLAGLIDGTVRLHALPQCCLPGAFEKYGLPGGVMDWKGDLLACTFQQRIAVINLRTGNQVCDIEALPLGVVLAPRKRILLATTTERGTLNQVLVAYSLETVEPLWKAFLAPRSNTVDVDPTETTFAATDDNVLLIGELSTGAVTWRLPHPKRVDEVAFIEESALIASTCHDGFLRIWDTASGKLVDEHKVHAVAKRLSIAKGGKRFLTMGDQQIAVWERSPWRRIVSIPERQRSAFACLLGAGETIAVQYPDGLSIWRVADGSEAMNWREYPFHGIARSHDGNQLVTLSSYLIDILDGRPE